MKIFVTGVTGFIGSQLAPALVLKGHTVYGLVRYNTTRAIKDVPFEIVYGDLSDHFLLKKANVSYFFARFPHSYLTFVL